MPVSKAQLKSTAKYEAANYDKFLVRFEKGKKEMLQAHAAGQGESLNAFINRAVDEMVACDKYVEQIAEQIDKEYKTLL